MLSLLGDNLLYVISSTTLMGNHLTYMIPQRPLFLWQNSNKNVKPNFLQNQSHIVAHSSSFSQCIASFSVAIRDRIKKKDAIFPCV